MNAFIQTQVSTALEAYRAQVAQPEAPKDRTMLTRQVGIEIQDKGDIVETKLV